MISPLGIGPERLPWGLTMKGLRNVHATTLLQVLRWKANPMVGQGAWAK